MRVILEFGRFPVNLQAMVANSTISDPIFQGAIAFLFLAILALFVAYLRLAKRVRTVDRLWSQLSDGIEAGNLEAILESQMKQNGKIESELSKIAERLTTAEAKLKKSKRYVGLVRYDAFGDVGGSQSFSLAVYDEDGDGAVITSQVGRSDCRVFGKQLQGGRTDVNLTVEEQQAIEIAASNRTRPRISP